MTVQLSMFGARYDGKQVDLFVKPACPLPEPAPQPPVACTAPEAPASLCPECGDVLPPRAKVCPNCYTTRTEYNAEDMARVIWADTLAKSEGR